MTSDERANSEMMEALRSMPPSRLNDTVLSQMIGRDWEDRVIPRRISPPNGYPSPKHWWAQAALKTLSDHSELRKTLSEVTGRDGHSEERERDIHMFSLTAARLRTLQAPTFFLSQELMDALDRTDVEKTMPMEEMMWPHESMLFVIPNARRFAEAEGIAGKSSHITTFTVTRVDHAQHGKSYIVTSVDNEGMTCYSHYPCKGTYSEQIEEHGDKFIMDCPTEFYQKEMGMRIDPDRIEADRRQIHETTRLAWKVLCAMNAVNETVAVGGSVVRPARSKGGRAVPALWSPVILDLSEKSSSTDGGGSGIGVRLHWRRGHFRRQAHGAGRSQRKVMWIKPHRVGSL